VTEVGCGRASHVRVAAPPVPIPTLSEQIVAVAGVDQGGSGGRGRSVQVKLALQRTSSE